MIITHENSEVLQKHELFIHPNFKIEGQGFLGVRSEYRTSLIGNVGPFGIVSESFLGSYLSITDVYCYNTSIGNYCSVAEGFIVLPSHDINRITTSRCTIACKTPSPHFANFKGQANYTFSYHSIIGHDVWIGCGVKMRNGLIIGHGAIIGAGSVLTKHVPPYAIVAGSPAKIIRMRFSENDIERLLKSEWFNYDWQNIEIDWGNMHNAISQMEDHIAAQDVPLLNSGFAYKTIDSQLQLHPATWSLDKQANVCFEVPKFMDLFDSPKIKQKLLKV